MNTSILLILSLLEQKIISQNVLKACFIPLYRSKDKDPQFFEAQQTLYALFLPARYKSTPGPSLLTTRLAREP